MLIAILVFVVLGAFVAAEALRTAGDTNASLNQNARGASVQHANPSRGAIPAIHGHAGSGNLNKEVTSGHHTS